MMTHCGDTTDGLFVPLGGDIVFESFRFFFFLNERCLYRQRTRSQNTSKPNYPNSNALLPV